MSKRWVQQLAALSAWLLGAVGLGLWFGGLSWWLVAALGAWLGVMLCRLYDLDRALDNKKPLFISTDRGMWAELLARVERVKDKARYRKKKYHRLLREVYKSTGALRDAGIILNPQHEIQWFNAAANQLLGLEASRDIGQRIDNLVRNPDFVAYLDAAQDHVITIPSPRDEVGRLAVQIIPYSRNQRLAIFRDITHEFRLERTRRDFVANASHELRSPLTVIGGYLDAMLDDASIPAVWKTPLTEMQRQVDRMTRIVRDLLELSRLESMEGNAGHEFVEVAAMLRGMHKEFEESGTKPRPSLALETDAALLGDESQLHSVFFNLINNAVRFTPDDGKVDVSWRATSDGVCFEVRDTGIGIPEELIPRVTERFFRVEPGRSRAAGGTGLGLAIVKHAVQRHDARLEIESELAKGSVFRCYFPPDRIATRGGARQAAVQ